VKKYLTLLLANSFLLGGCANELYSSLPYYMKEKKLPPPTVENFPHCEGYGCPVIKNVKLNEHDWNIILSAYGNKAQDPVEERIKVARTVGAFERVAGKLTGTDGDIKGTFMKTGKGQLDCVDESSNTTIYMMLLKQKGLLRFHEIEQPQVRWPIVSGRGWMHQTAVVTEKQTGKQYAIDSWFEDNGVSAWVVPMEAWRNGWHPDQMKPQN
jgi:hypothetical protein